MRCVQGVRDAIACLSSAFYSLPSKGEETNLEVLGPILIACTLLRSSGGETSTSSRPPGFFFSIELRDTVSFHYLAPYT
jgi:hypothetical protein